MFSQDGVPFRQICSGFCDSMRCGGNIRHRGGSADGVSFVLFVIVYDMSVSFREPLCNHCDANKDNIKARGCNLIVFLKILETLLTCDQNLVSLLISKAVLFKLLISRTNKLQCREKENERWQK